MNDLPFSGTRKKHIPHYHGDKVRKLFIAAGITLLIVLPIFGNVLPISTFALTLSVVLLIVFAALTNPILRWVNIVDVLISTAGVVVFELIAVVRYAPESISFIASQGLAILFLFALYYSARTARAIATGQLDPNDIRQKDEPEPEDLGEERSNEAVLEDIGRGHGF